MLKFNKYGNWYHIAIATKIQSHYRLYALYSKDVRKTVLIALE